MTSPHTPGTGPVPPHGGTPHGAGAPVSPAAAGAAPVSSPVSDKAAWWAFSLGLTSIFLIWCCGLGVGTAIPATIILLKETQAVKAKTGKSFWSAMSSDWRLIATAICIGLTILVVLLAMAATVLGILMRAGGYGQNPGPSYPTY